MLADNCSEDWKPYVLNRVDGNFVVVTTKCLLVMCRTEAQKAQLGSW